MNLTKIFQKAVDRPIDGVIKADDLASLRHEVEEYVLTNEVEKRLGSFLDAYNTYEGANGVWISGFFGSGKSHLLKILALLLENREVDGIRVLDAFLSKCKHDELLTAELKRACGIPSQSILFNIDQKADVTSKKDSDALLAVFVKVFDEMCGYYGKQAYVAQFERSLDKRDLYGKFKASYESIAGVPWGEGREDILFGADDIAKAYAESTGASLESGQGILDKFRSDYTLSIEDFADQVHEYIQRQEKNFRLNFFVDEVGQYIADNKKLMTNLQTVAESLATKCRGRAWVVVTAQEDMNTVVGERGKQQSNDFSKIMARFANKMKLTSKDVAEVIQKRLLKKNEEGENLLQDLYHREQANFKTLFDFSDGAQTYINFRNADHFVQAYPFIPYQFELFQNAIQTLSSHNAFEGRHSSVGERSMLAVFQEVAIQIADHKLGQLATFDLMFGGIHNALKASTQGAIFSAEKNLDDQFAVRLLKTLYLVKYVKGFKATVRNLCVLMLDSFDSNLSELKTRVEQALNLLEQQTYVQRNGDLYEFLTDEEKDVEEEIKHTDVENAEISNTLAEIVFDRVIKTKKIRYDENGQDYSFGRKLDEHLIGREHELTIHVISPFHENSGKEEVIRAHALGKLELTVLMQPDARIFTDLLMYKKTEKYVRHNQGTAQQESVGRILAEKANQNHRRMDDLRERVASQMGKASILVSGDALELSGEDANSKIIRGFYELVTRTYPNLRMLRKTSFKEQEVPHYLQEGGNSLFANDAVAMSEAEQELFAFIQGNQQAGTRSTLKSLVAQFEKKPYGWHLGAILCVFAKICARAKVEVVQDGTSLEDDSLASAIRNSAQHANLVLLPQNSISNAQIKDLLEFYEDFFDCKTESKEAKSLGKEVADAFSKKLLEVRELFAQIENYPFLKSLEPLTRQLADLGSKPYSYYLNDFLEKRDELLDLKENQLDPMIRFMTGSARGIYDEARKFLYQQEANFDYLPTDQLAELSKLLDDVEIYRGKGIQQIKTLREKISAELDSKLVLLVQQGQAKILELRDRVTSMGEYAKIQDDQQAIVNGLFDGAEDRLTKQRIIPVVNDMLRRFEEQDYPGVLEKVLRWSVVVPVPKAPEEKGSRGEPPVHQPQPEVRINIVSAQNIKLSYNKPMLDDEQDVNDYVSAVKEAMLAELKAGNRVRI